MKIGNDDFSAGYVGNDQVVKLAMGNEIVWPLVPDYPNTYMTVEALSSGTFRVRNENFEFSKNGGAWTSGVGNQSINLSTGDKVMFRHNANAAYPGMFSGNTMQFKVYGNIESMEYGSDFADKTTVRVAKIGSFGTSGFALIIVSYKFGE